MERREFLAKSLLSAVAFSLAKPVLAAGEISDISLNYVNDHKKLLDLIEKSKKSYDYIFMSGIDPTIEFIHNRQHGDIGAIRPGIVFFNDKYESAIVDIPAPVFPHSIEQNPHNLNRVMLIPRRGQSCVEYDISTNKIVSEITLKDRKFYGHGCYIPGTDLFYTSTYLRSSSDASMLLFDVKKNKVLKEVEVPGGAGSHQCAVSRDKKHIIITFSRSTKTHRPSVAWLDIKTGEVVKRVYGLPEHVEHFSENTDGSVLYTGGVVPTEKSSTPGCYGFINEEKASAFFYDPKDAKLFEGQGVGVLGVESKGYCFITNNSQNRVYVFDYKTGKNIKNIEISLPRGVNISNDGKYIVITSLSKLTERKALISYIDIETLKVTHEFNVDHALAYSTHTSKFKFS